MKKGRPKKCRDARQFPTLKELGISRDQSAQWQKLARMLKPFEVEARAVRIGDKTPRGYDYDTLESVFSLYLEVLSATSATSQ